MYFWCSSLWNFTPSHFELVKCMCVCVWKPMIVCQFSKCVLLLVNISIVVVEIFLFSNSNPLFYISTWQNLYFYSWENFIFFSTVIFCCFLEMNFARVALRKKSFGFWARTVKTATWKRNSNLKKKQQQCICFAMTQMNRICYAFLINNMFVYRRHVYRLVWRKKWHTGKNLFDFSSIFRLPKKCWNFLTLKWRAAFHTVVDRLQHYLLYFERNKWII